MTPRSNTEKDGTEREAHMKDDPAASKLQMLGVKKAFGDNHVLNGIDLSIAPGQSLVVIGGSGQGTKSWMWANSAAPYQTICWAICNVQLVPLLA